MSKVLGIWKNFFCDEASAFGNGQEDRCLHNKPHTNSVRNARHYIQPKKDKKRTKKNVVIFSVHEYIKLLIRIICLVVYLPSRKKNITTFLYTPQYNSLQNKREQEPEISMNNRLNLQINFILIWQATHYIAKPRKTYPFVIIFCVLEQLHYITSCKLELFKNVSIVCSNYIFIKKK